MELKIIRLLVAVIVALAIGLIYYVEQLHDVIENEPTTVRDSEFQSLSKRYNEEGLAVLADIQSAEDEQTKEDEIDQRHAPSVSRLAAEAKLAPIRKAYLDALRSNLHMAEKDRLNLEAKYHHDEQAIYDDLYGR